MASTEEPILSEKGESKLDKELRRINAELAILDDDNRSQTNSPADGI